MYKLLLILMLLVTTSCTGTHREDKALLCIGACSLYESDVSKDNEEVRNDKEAIEDSNTE